MARAPAQNDSRLWPASSLYESPSIRILGEGALEAWSDTREEARAEAEAEEEEEEDDDEEARLLAWARPCEGDVVGDEEEERPVVDGM